MNDAQRAASVYVWQAYNAMESTKQRHFDLLSALEAKHKKFNLPPTDADQGLLADLLRDHDEQVDAFKRASDQLRQSDPAAHTALFQYIGRINQALGPLRARDSH